jgi:antitoxin component YwqK of YwqJK toxin-antitoxin module
MKALLALTLLVATLPAKAEPVLEERRTFYPSGRPYQVRHFYNGREEGPQQAWTEAGELYVNYVMRDGRRYGAMNARPCDPVEVGR